MAFNGSSRLSTRFLLLAIETVESIDASLIISSSSQKVAFGQGEPASVFSARDPAGIIEGGRGNLPKADPYRLRLIFGIGIERVLARVPYDEHVHLGSKVDVIAGFRILRDEIHSTVPIHVDTAEEVQIRDEIAPTKPPFAHLDQKAVAAILVVVVANVLIGRAAVLVLDALAIRSA